jgi:hypothetical protein
MKIVETYKEAVTHVMSNYWVEPVDFAPTPKGESASQLFDRDYTVTDYSESGLVHYSRK